MAYDALNRLTAIDYPSDDGGKEARGWTNDRDRDADERSGDDVGFIYR